jgi:hypothetical protein
LNTYEIILRNIGVQFIVAFLEGSIHILKNDEGMDKLSSKFDVTESRRDLIEFVWFFKFYSVNLLIQFLTHRFTDQLSVPHASLGCYLLLESEKVQDNNILELVKKYAKFQHFILARVTCSDLRTTLTELWKKLMCKAFHRRPATHFSKLLNICYFTTFHVRIRTLMIKFVQFQSNFLRTLNCSNSG